MEFVYPQFFWVMIVPFAIFVFLVTTNRDKVARVFSEQVLESLRADSEALPNSLRNLVLFAAVFLMIVALARPVIDKGEKVVHLQGITLLTALDISGSMRSRDRYPNRLAFAKKKIYELLEKFGETLDKSGKKHSPSQKSWLDGVKKFFEDMKS